MYVASACSNKPKFGQSPKVNIIFCDLHILPPFLNLSVMRTGPGHWKGNLTHICYVDEINQTHALGWCAPTDQCSQVLIMLFRKAISIQISNFYIWYIIIIGLIRLGWFCHFLQRRLGRFGFESVSTLLLFATGRPPIALYHIHDYCAYHDHHDCDDLYHNFDHPDEQHWNVSDVILISALWRSSLLLTSSCAPSMPSHRKQRSFLSNRCNHHACPHLVSYPSDDLCYLCLDFCDHHPGNREISNSNVRTSPHCNV